MTVIPTSTIIPGTGSISPGVQLLEPGLVAIQIGPNWTPASLSLQLSLDGVTWQNALIGGVEFVAAVAAGTYYPLNPNDWAAATWVKARSGTAEAPVVQAQDAQVTFLSTVPAPPPPPAPPPVNPARTIKYTAIGQSGLFTPYLTTDTGIATFDLSGLLQAGETLTGIASFTLSVEGPRGATDPAITSRIVTAAAINGTSVNVELGNWQDLPLMQYAATLVFSTNYTPEQTVLGFVSVTKLAPFPQNPPCVCADGVVVPVFPMPWDF